MAQVKQVPGSQVSAQFVIDAHQISLYTLETAVDYDHWRSHPDQPAGHSHITAGGSHHQAIYPFFKQHPQVAALFFRVVVAVTQDHAIVVALAVVLDTSRQLGKVGVQAIGH